MIVEGNCRRRCRGGSCSSLDFEGHPPLEVLVSHGGSLFAIFVMVSKDPVMGEEKMGHAIPVDVANVEAELPLAHVLILP